MGSCAADSTIVKIWREHPPSSYSLKINKLSQFTLDKYESRPFLSGGFNWRLVIYPEGNQTDDGSGFISMYVEFDNTSVVSTPPTEVFAYLTFFVYNKKENKYFTIQDVEVKRFNALRTVWGFSQVLSLETFSDFKNGYIFEGFHCEFGVDVMVASPFTNWEVVSFNEKLTNPKFSWSVKDFSLLEENLYASNTFSIGGRKWVLEMYPKGKSIADGKWLSIYLHLAASEIILEGEKIYVRADLRVLDPRGSNHLTKALSVCYAKTNEGWGWEQYVSIDILREAYLDEDDTLTVETEFEVVSATKFSPIT